MTMRIGVTGGIGSGKSEVCEKFRLLGVKVLFADNLARHLTDTDPELKKKIISLLGLDAYDPVSGILKREYVSEVVFKNEKKLTALNSIVHPAVLKAIDLEARNIEKEGKERYLLIEAALMFESGLNKEVDYILTVAADEEVRRKRLLKRNKLSDDQIRLRMSAQYPIEEGIQGSDFVLFNNESIDTVREKVNFFHQIFLSLHPRKKRSHGHT